MRLLIGILLVAAVFALGAQLRMYREAPEANTTAITKPIAEPVAEPAASLIAKPGNTTDVAPPAEPEKASQPVPADKPQEQFEPVRRDVRNVTPDHVLPGPEIEAALIERLPALTPPPPPKPVKPRTWPRAAVLSAGSVRSRETRIDFAGIRALEAKEECKAADGTAWRCGNFARAALQRLIRLRPLDCDTVDETADGSGEGQEPVTTRCRVAGRDIAEWLVAQGWAKALPESGYEDAQAAAQQAGRGQWRRENPQRARPARALLQPGVPEPVIPDAADPEPVGPEVPTVDQGF